MTAIASQLLQVKRQINTQEIQEHTEVELWITCSCANKYNLYITHDTNDHIDIDMTPMFGMFRIVILVQIWTMYNINVYNIL